MMRRCSLPAALAAAVVCGAAWAHRPAEAPPPPAASESGIVASVDLDKARQRRDGIRTVAALAAPAVAAVPGRVVADPRQALRIAADQDGIVQPPPGGLPLPGAVVDAGKPLLYLRPSFAETERSDLRGDLAAAQRDVQLGRLQIERYHVDENQQFDVQLPTPSIQLLTDYRSAKARQAGIERSLGGVVAVTARRGGTVVRSVAAAGAVVTAGQTLLELAGNGALAVEAWFTDDDLDPDSATRALTPEGGAVALEYLGGGYDRGLRAHRVVYALQPGGAKVQPGEPLTLELACTGAGPSVRLPARSVVRLGAQTVVWLHASAERFVARPVRGRAAGDDQYDVQQGLSGGERVVVDGAAELAAALRQ